ncbi:MAG: MaoC family dehydratase [Alphaproteobacteria bacterium]
MGDKSKEYYMEDLAVGQRYTSGPIDVSEQDAIEFARKYDPQEFHTDPEEAKLSLFGGLIISGWHTAALTMRLIIEASPKMKGGMVGRSVEKISWLRPVKPGDKLRYEGEILDLRPSNSQPMRGIMRVKNTTFNQLGEPVLEMESVVFVPRRP